MVRPRDGEYARGNDIRDAAGNFRDQVAACCAHIGRTGDILSANEGFCDIVGHDRASVVASTLQKLTDPAQVAATLDRVEALFDHRIPHYVLEKRYRRSNGNFIWVLEAGSLAPRRPGQPDRAVVTAQDISERKVTESHARENEARFSAILETVPDAMIVIGERGHIEAFSTTAQRLFGYSPAEVLGSNVNILMPSPYRDEHDGYLERHRTTGERRIIGTGRIVVGQRRDRSMFPMLLTVGEASWGNRRFHVGFVRDLTESRDAEVRTRELQTELAHLSRYTALGEMAGTLAHELNQPLTAIVGFLKGSRRLLDRAGGKVAAELSGAMDQAANEALRAGEIIRRLREFVVRRDGEHQVEDLQNLVEEACALALIGSREQGVQVSFRFDRRATSVLADRIQIQQVIVNLLRNSVEAMAQSARHDLTVTIDLRDDGNAEVAVIDTGTGISPDIAGQLFRPFITTKPTGMGVGLSISRSIVESHNGRIWAEANPEGGTAFRFTLPAVTAGDLDRVE
jgi:two-component system sensor kinase FixL